MNVSISNARPSYAPPIDAGKASAAFGAAPLRGEQIEQLTQSMLQQMLDATTNPGTGKALVPGRPQLRKPEGSAGALAGEPAQDAPSDANGAGEPVQQAPTDAGEPVRTPASVTESRLEAVRLEGDAPIDEAALGEAERLTPDAALIKLLGELGAALQKSSLDELNQRLEQFKAFNESVRAQGEKLSGELDQAQAQAKSALEEATAASEQVKDLTQQAAQAREKADRLGASLQSLSAEDPAYPAAQLAYQQALATADSLGQQAQQAIAALQPLTQQAAGASQKLEEVEQKINALPIAQPNLKQAMREAALTNAALLSQLMAALSEVVAHASQAKVEANSDLAIKQLKASQKENLRKSAEYEAQVEKSKALEKALGCFGKILGYIAIVVGTVFAAVSGGASLVLAGIGLVMTIVSETTGFSLLNMALEPLMKYVIEPMIKGLGEVFSSILESMGVDKAEAKRVGGILGIVVAVVLIVVVVIAAVVLGRSAGGSIMSKIMPVLSRAITRAMPEIVKSAGRMVGQVSTRLTAAIARQIGTSVEQVTARMAVAHAVNTGVQVVGQMVQGSGGVAVAAAGIDEAETLAALQNNIQANKAIEALLKSMEEEFSAAGDLQVQLFKLIAEAMQGQAATAKSILHGVAVAA